MWTLSPTDRMALSGSVRESVCGTSRNDEYETTRR
jgi:hypothetical protein